MTAPAPVPEWLIGPMALFVACVFLFSMVLVALALVQMKPENLKVTTDGKKRSRVAAVIEAVDVEFGLSTPDEEGQQFPGPDVRALLGLAPPGLAPPGMAPPGLAPPGLAPPGLAPPCESQQASAGLAPPGLASLGLAPPGLAPPCESQQAPSGLAPPGLAPPGLAPLCGSQQAPSGLAPPGKAHTLGEAWFLDLDGSALTSTAPPSLKPAVQSLSSNALGEDAWPDDPSWCLLALVAHGGLLGFATHALFDIDAEGSPCAPYMSLHYLAVEAAQRGAGHGQKLLGALVVRAQNEGAQAIRLYSRREAVGFYRKFGFHVVEQGQGSELLMELLLSNSWPAVASS